MGLHPTMIEYVDRDVALQANVIIHAVSFPQVRRDIAGENAAYPHLRICRLTGNTLLQNVVTDCQSVAKYLILQHRVEVFPVEGRLVFGIRALGLASINPWSRIRGQAAF